MPRGRAVRRGRGGRTGEKRGGAPTVASEEEEERRPARKEEEGCRRGRRGRRRGCPPASPTWAPPLPCSLCRRPAQGVRWLAEAGAATHAGKQQRAEQSASRVATHAGSRNARPSPPPSVRWASAAPSPGGHGRRDPLLLPRSVARAVAMECAQRRGRGRVSCAGRSSAAPRWSRGPAAGGGEGPGGRQRREGGGPDMWAPHVRSTSTSHVDGLTSGTVIWTSREPISKFRDSDVYFGSLGTGMTPPAKFRGRRCILLNDFEI